MELLQRARESGRVVPALINNEESVELDGFGSGLLQLLDVSGFRLSPEKVNGDRFASLLEKADSIERIPSSVPDAEAKKRALILRRSMLLAVAGGTPIDSPSLSQALSQNYLNYVKNWLDDVLSGAIGTVDFLLHLLSNIAELPVTKSVVKSSSMGKVISQVEKSHICVGTPNEAAILERVQLVKDAWNSSVKQRKDETPFLTPVATSETGTNANVATSASVAEVTPVDTSSSAISNIKRSAESDEVSSASAKKLKSTPSNSFSTLLRKVSGSNGIAKPAISGETSPDSNANKPKKISRRVKWSDHFGNELTESEMISSDEATGGENVVGSPTSDPVDSLYERNKRDRLREKELLSRVKKSKLMDDDEDDHASIVAQTSWRAPTILPTVPDATKAELNSLEIARLNDRMATIMQAVYRSDNVPSSPDPLNDVEQALDMTSQSSTVIQTIPFFVPQVPSTVAPAPAPNHATPFPPPPGSLLPSVNTSYTAQPQPVSYGQQVSGATPEFLQSLGLPMFLVGQDTAALQVLSASPSLLSNLVDQQGNYDQARLLTLVQTLSTASAPSAPAPSSISSFKQQNLHGIYGPGAVAGSSAYGQPSPTYSGAPSRKNNPDGNLHISGYGLGTTEQDIINLFAPYVIVDEVVMKGSFAFVNTSDPENAQRAREALTGSYLGNMPIRINPAQRKARDPSHFSATTGSTNFPYGSHSTNYGGVRNSNFGSSTNFGYSGAQKPNFGGDNEISVGSFNSAIGQPYGLAVSSVHGAAGGHPSAVGQGIPGSGLPGSGMPGSGMPGSMPGSMIPAAPIVYQGHQQVVPNVDSVRDDRGNPATKNLFVAGYGAGTTEEQLRVLFSQHGKVVGVVLKGSFSFVNLADRMSSVMSRNALSNVMVNGGMLRINFAKETGRLGTSFDLTYNPSSGPNYRKPIGGPSSMSYYGRG